RLAAAACLAAIAVQPAHAADAPAWPAAGKSIRIVVPFPAGSGSDSLARMLAAKVAEQTGAAVVIDNKPGGSTVIGAQHVARAQADGYTLLYTVVVTHTQNPHLVKNLPYDPFKDFTPVLQVVRSATVLSANKETPFDTTKEMIEYAKANPGKLNFGSYSTGSTSHLTGEILQQEAAMHIVQVPSEGTAAGRRPLPPGEVTIGWRCRRA